MTLHDKLKEIPVEFNTTETGRLVLSDSTISAIIQAVAERLPGEDTMPVLDDFDRGYVKAWNAYREEVRKVLAEKL